MTIYHPIRSEPINVWQAPAGQDSPAWIAKFGTGKNMPIFFEGPSEESVRAKAEAFRADVVAKNEATYVNRREAILKARDAAAKKKKAPEEAL